MIGIIGAMDEEISELRKIIIGSTKERIGNIDFYKGKIHGKDVVLAECGIGKVNAAICTTLMIQYFKTKNIVFTGVAGGIATGVSIGDIVVGTYLMEHDFDTSSFGDDLGVIPRMDTSKFLCDPDMADKAYDIAVQECKNSKVHKGIIISGDQFIASKEKIFKLRDIFNASCTEMEGAATAHVCHVFGIPFVVIRSISDRADSEAKIDYSTFVKKAAVISKNIVERLVSAI